MPQPPGTATIAVHGSQAADTADPSETQERLAAASQDLGTLDNDFDSENENGKEPVEPQRKEPQISDEDDNSSLVFDSSSSLIFDFDIEMRFLTKETVLR